MNAVSIAPMGDVFLIVDYVSYRIYAPPFDSYEEAYQYAKDNFLAVVPRNVDRPFL